MSEPFQFSLFANPADESTASQEAFPVRMSVLPVKVGASARKRNRALRGATCSGSFEDYGRFGSSLKTFLACELSRLTGFSLRWNESATPAGRSWSVLSILARHTEGIGCGSWPTPKAADGRPKGNGGARKSPGLDQMARQSQWPTPAFRDWKADGHCAAAQARKSPCLPAAVHLQTWPSPMAHEARLGYQGRTNPDAKGSQKSLTTIAVDCAGLPAQASHSTIGKPRGSLNQAWVAQLQGVPDGWLDLPEKVLLRVWEMQTRRSVPRSSVAP